MTTLTPYKGFQGAVEYDGGALFIRLLHIDDTVSTTCVDASEVEMKFRELIDEYIETCKEIGKEPDRPFKGSFNVRIKSNLHRDAAMAAAANDLTLNAWVEQAIYEKLTGISEGIIEISKFDLMAKHSEPQSVSWVERDGNVLPLEDWRETLKRKKG
jgi:predicted HicB family RNase H-like nuclease